MGEPGDVAVVGLGLMGASFALALKKARPDLRLLGVDRDPGTLHKAVDRGIVAAASDDLSLARAATVVVVAVPMAGMREVLGGLAGHRGVITDMAGVKVPVMAVAASCRIDLVGGHPMCGRETSGLEGADPSIFTAAPWVLTRAEPAIEELVRAVGARPLVMDPAEHDRLVAGISHAAFTVSVAYMRAMAGAADWPQMAELASSGFRDMTRLAAGDPEMYSALARINRGALVARLDLILEELTRVKRHLEHDDPRLVELFEEAKNARERWSESRARQG